jgi:hypothetical protein
MDFSAAQSTRGSALAVAVAFARREPATVLAALLGLHLLVWTLLPFLVCPNLQLDLVDELALGKEWQLGYWKHPSLPWWAADLVFRLVGDPRAVYLLGPLAVVICFYGIWLLAREVVGEFEALIAVAVLEGTQFYNFSAVKFNHDVLLLPFWVFTTLFFYRAVARGRNLDWIAAGVFLGLAFWSKYTALVLAGTMGLFLLVDPIARRAWFRPGPYLMALSFAAVVAPNAWWLVDNDFMPFRHIDARAVAATHWYNYLVFPLRWIGSQILFTLPTIGLMGLVLAGGRRAAPADEQTAFHRRAVTVLALGPFAATTLVAALTGRLPIAMWGYPFWSLAPLAALVWFSPTADPRRLQRFALALVGVLVAFPVAYAAAEIGEPFVRDRSKATQFPGQQLAAIVTRQWHDRYGTPLVYVSGSEFAANNVAVYSPDHPHVLVRGEPRLSPWIDMRDLGRRGAVVIWEEGHDQADLERWRATFPGLDIQPTLVLARQTWHPVQPDRVNYAFVPPRP